jgi:hypothetical protein
MVFLTTEAPAGIVTLFSHVRHLCQLFVNKSWSSACKHVITATVTSFTNHCRHKCRSGAQQMKVWRSLAQEAATRSTHCAGKIVGSAGLCVELYSRGEWIYLRQQAADSLWWFVALCKQKTNNESHISTLYLSICPVSMPNWFRSDVSMRRCRAFISLFHQVFVPPQQFQHLNTYFVLSIWNDLYRSHNRINNWMNM